MPRRKRYSKAMERELTTGEYMEMLLGHGEVKGSDFETPFLKRAAWEHHREELMSVCGEGIRPDAFWQFEHPAMHDAGTGERLEYLRKHGLLEPWEEARLKAWEEMRKGDTSGDHDNGLFE